MKAASAATLSILASGQYIKLEFYKFVLPKLGTFYFTNADHAITTGGQTWATGLTIVRSAFTQKTGLAVQSVNLTIAPQADNPGGPVTLGGAGFLSQCRAGAFDGGVVTIYKGFFVFPSSGGAIGWSADSMTVTADSLSRRADEGFIAGFGAFDFTPGIVAWFQGVIDRIQVGRFSLDLTVNDTIQLLNVQMPRNILQSGCVHALFDAGCTLLKASFTSSGSIVGAVTANSFTTGLTQADGYFALGVITFTSGVLNGSSYSLSAFTHTGGVVKSIAPWASLPTAGDTFTIVPGDDKTQATCSGKFSNLAHYRGAPFVPQPETLYDGGTSATTAPALGGQGGQGAGSSFGGGRGKGSYGP